MVEVEVPQRANVLGFVTADLAPLAEQGPTALVQLREPVNKFPGFVRHAVQQLKAVYPGMGKACCKLAICPGRFSSSSLPHLALYRAERCGTASTRKGYKESLGQHSGA